MAVQKVKPKQVDLKNDRVILEDGRVLPLDPELKQRLTNPESRKITSGVLAEERDWLKKQEDVPVVGGVLGSIYAMSKAVGDSDFGIWKNLLSKYALDPAAAATSKTDLGTVDTIKAQKRGRSIAAKEAQEKYPLSYKVGQGLAIASDFGTSLPKLLSRSPLATGAAYGFSAAPPLYEDPEATAKGTLTGAALGYAGGRAMEGLGRVASQRGALRRFAQESEAFPQQTREAREAFRQTQREKLNSASTDLRRGVAKESLKNEEFLNRTLRVSDIAGSKEAGSVQKFINTIKSGLSGRLSANDVVRIFDAVEGRIIRATAEELPLLQAYKSHLVDVIPVGAAHQAVKESIGRQVIERVKIGGDKLGKVVDKRISDVVEKMTPEEFYASLSNGNLANVVRTEIKEGYKDFYASRYSGKTKGKENYLRGVEERAESFVNKQADWINKDINALRSEANDLASYVYKITSSRIRNATGSPNPIAPTIPPTNRLQLPQQPVRPQTGGMAERFEQPFRPFEQVTNALSGSANAGFLGKVLGIPGSLAKAGVGAVTGVGRTVVEGAGRLLTSPHRLSEMTRDIIARGGIPVLIESIAATYPSYDKGILLDPLDRQDAVAELENNPYIPLEQKAILQAKINRGRSLEELQAQEEVR